MHHFATEVRFLDDVLVECTFQDGSVYQYDMSQMFDKYPQLKELRDNRSLFESGKLCPGGDAVVWNDELDFDASSIYECGVLIEKKKITLNLQIGLLLLGLREDLGVTQKELSKLSNINQGDISRIEMGKGNPTIKKLEKLFKALGKSLIIDVE